MFDFILIVIVNLKVLIFIIFNSLFMNLKFFLSGTGNLLSSYIKEHPKSLGSNISQKFGSDLCFLFKVLSVNQALSIQAHPEKVTGNLYSQCL